MSCCAVATCGNYSRKTKEAGLNVVYHRFPKDKELCKNWLTKCKREDAVNCKSAVICSDHFSPNHDYEDDMKNRLLGLPQKRILHKSAIPSLNLPPGGNSFELGLNIDRMERVTKRRIRLQAIETITKLSPKKARVEQPVLGSLNETSSLMRKESFPVTCSNCNKLELLVNENVVLKNNLESLQQKVITLTKQQQVLRKTILKTNKSHSKTIKKHAKMTKTIKRDLSIFKTKYENIISIESLLGLFKDLNKIGLKFIMTTRLTQDVLESFFGQIRGVGSFADHPTATEVITRIKKIMLSNKMPKPSPRTNITEEKSNHLDVYLTAELVDSAFTQDEFKEIVAPTNTTDEDADDLLDDDILGIEVLEKEQSLSSERCWAEEEALSYVAGYVAYRVRKQDPTLGTMSRNVSEESNSSDTWIKSLSLGKLTVPSPQWKKTVSDFELIFKAYHGENNSFSKDKCVIAELKRRLTAEFPQHCKQAIHVYARVRTFIRLRNLNQYYNSRRGEMKKSNKWLKSNKNPGPLPASSTE